MRRGDPPEVALQPGQPFRPAARNAALANEDIKQGTEIEVASQTTPEVISLQFMNMLDGCKFQLELATTNQYDLCD